MDMLELQKPLVGYAMWWLARGATVHEIQERMAHHREYGALPPEYHADAIRVALANVQITNALIGMTGYATKESVEEWQKNPSRSGSITLRELLSRLVR